jgi:uracil-DNA glycosylase
MLWGAHAQAKRTLLGSNTHCVLEAPHPSPLSAHRGFLGCRHFALANNYLEAHGRSPIDWRLPDEAQMLA